ncbi:YbgA family protein [Simiduia aestuariiviva]|uniref:Uncharacterized protein YbgA (DUF1722 family)/uncharacterized protein YbbK (DUF523 family) n=1 Tax=Simiduia aestuariiviva TaxID=1510459 RepID=A0A839UM29_9GAMM|nr:DUF523 and DUF1722 domain-containing protein [Simiduia aestuariiviva]MBB3167831.1 uncharacterized protein YbgA (DUF1722 family)/uncharacterized protein YbbK (DUF523 family) [Simiduia aestuariiviva]
MAQGKIYTLGISACLLGEKVRFNAGHKRSAFCAETLATQAELIPVCPEVAIGLPVPRKAIRLMHDGDDLRVVPSKGEAGDVDYGPALRDVGKAFMARHPNLDGFVFMNDSPSCGPAHVKTYRANGYQAGRDGVGFFARAVQEINPLLPVEDAGRLNDPAIRENFMVRIGVYRDWRQLNRAPLTAGSLIKFYSPYKYLLMAHSQVAYKQVGRLLANHEQRPVEDVAQDFIEALMAGLKVLADRKGHANVLMHLLGYFKKHLDSDDRQEVLAVIHNYRKGIIPLVTPVTLFQHHLRRAPNAYLQAQKYWQPHAPELGLRSAI